MSIEKVVEHYVAKRDELKALKERHKEEIAPYQAQLDKIESALLEVLNRDEVESMRTKAGTVYKSDVMSASVDDWETLLAWLIESKQWPILTKAVSKVAVREYMEEAREPVPGVSTSVFTKVGIRRS
jgi:hypothetical protein